MARMRRLRRGRNSNIFNGKRIVISTSQGGSEGQALHNNIIRGIIKTDFIQSRSTTDKMIHTVNVHLKENTPGEFATEEAFSETVSRMNNYSFPYYKTSYSIPIDSNLLSSFENPGKIPTVRFDPRVNYLESEVFNTMRYTTNESYLPDIYKEVGSYSKQHIINKMTGIRQTNRRVEPKMNVSSINKNKDSFPCLVECRIFKDEVDGFKSILENSGLLAPFITNANAKVKDRISIRDDRTFAVSNHNYLLLNNLVSGLEDSFSTSAQLIVPDVRPPLDKINFLDKLKLIGDLQKKSLYHSNYKTIFEKEYVPNETIFYKIKKFSSEQSTTPLKTYLVPCIDGITSLVDSQVIYNKTYYYQISAFVAIYGVGCRYVLKSADYDKKMATYDIISEPSPMVLEVNISRNRVLVSPGPPLPPSVNFINNSNSENKIKMMLELQKGEQDDTFVQLLSEDSLLRMNINNVTKKVRFSHNNERLMVQAFRLEKKPKSIIDFRDGSIQVIGRSIQDFYFNPTNLIFEDNVFPNKKYYYTFRTLSMTGLVSNPSGVYEVELIKDSDESSLLIEPVVLDKDLTSSFMKFRNLLQVRPAPRHTILTPVDTTGVTTRSPLDDYRLGNTNNPIWGRKFKFRIRSNDSGKIIDLNIDFSLIKDKIRKE